MVGEIGEVLLWVILAALAGLVLGYLFGRLFGDGRGAEATRELHAAQQRNEEHLAAIASLRDAATRSDAVTAKLQAELEARRVRAAELVAEAGTLRTAVAAHERTIAELGGARPGNGAAVAAPAAPAAPVALAAAALAAPAPVEPAPVAAAPAPAAGAPAAVEGDIADIEGIGPVYERKLRAADVPTIARLRDVAATARGRAELAARTGIREALILTWVNHADLLRVDGVDPQAAELLEAGGVDSPTELAHRNAANLAATLAAVNAEKKLVRDVPDEQTLAAWIAHAGTLEKLVRH